MTTILVSIDGVRPDALVAANCPHINGLRQCGSWTFKARSVMPSITLPCHMSTFHSVPPSRHGITTNDWQPMARPLPGLVEQANAANRKAAFFYNWDPLRNLCTPLQLHFSYFRNNTYSDLENGDKVIAAEAVRYLASDNPDFAFVYLSTADTAGHMYNWMSDGYLQQVERVDAAFGVLLEGIPTGFTLLVHSDHGGHERTHGTDSPEDMLIPWLIMGPGIRQGHEIEAAVSLLDTAPTLAAIMDIPAHRDWEGNCISEIFEPNH
jgi:predicted AlkP superfamily pyrophosphatase or phosphodiesterase